MAADDEILIDLPIDTGRGVPIFRQIQDAIRYASASGRLLPGDRLPSVRSLARTLSLNPATVQKAYRELEIRGRVEVRRGQGTFVAESPPTVSETERIETVWLEIQGLLATAREMDIDREELRDLFEQGLDDVYVEDLEDESGP